MHEHIEKIMRQYLLKSFKIIRKVSASDFNNNVYKKKLKKESRKKEVKDLLFNFGKNPISSEQSIDKSKPVLTHEEIIEGNQVEFHNVNEDLDIINKENDNLDDNHSEEELQSSAQLNNKIIRSTQFLHEMIFKYLGKSDLDKASIITIMNIINKMVYQMENITDDDIKKFIKNNKKKFE